jgi:hypothetical protein
MASEENELHVYITHFIPPRLRWYSFFVDFIVSRLSVQYLRSWARLLKYGTRGFQPWKRDIMTKPRRERSASRDVFLKQVIQSLENLRVESLVINIFTNTKFSVSTSESRTLIKLHTFPRYNRMNSINNSPWVEEYIKSPWNLLWEHKQLLKDSLREEFAKPRLHLVLENDVLFTQDNLDYWLKHRANLRKIGLVPSFVRLEYCENKEEYLCIDLHDVKLGTSDKQPNWIRFIEEKQVYLQIPTLYSGMSLFDGELLAEYVNSKAIDKATSKELVWWDLGARASMGVQFLNVPKAFLDRHALALDETSLQVLPSACVHHLPNLYVSVCELTDRFPSVSDLADIVSSLETRG